MTPFIFGAIWAPLISSPRLNEVVWGEFCAAPVVFAVSNNHILFTAYFIYVLKKCHRQVSPPTLRRQAGAGGLGSEGDDVLSRRRTISGPESLPVNENDLLPREQVPKRPEPRPRSTVGSASSSDVADSAATLRRRPRPPVTVSSSGASGASTVVTMTTGSDTIRRKPRTSEDTEGAVISNNQSDTGREVQQNGGVVLRRRPVSEACDRTEPGKETCEWMEARKSLKPPVSPKPSTVNLRKSQADPPTPTRRVPIPGPETTETAQSPGEMTTQLVTGNQTSRDVLRQVRYSSKRVMSCFCLNRTQACSSSRVTKTPWTSYCP